MTDAPLIGPVPAPELHVMTYNIRRRIPHLRPGHPDRWATRKWLLRLLLATEKPTLVAVQEALADQAAFVGVSLGSRYGRVGHGRNANGRGESTLIYYDTHRLDLLRSKQQALSPTPEKPGSRGWGNLVPRVVVSADFADRTTGTHVYAFATHFDHLSRRSRTLAARMIVKLAAAAHISDPHAMIVVLGDVNADVGSPAYRDLTASGLLRDAWDAGERITPQWGTFSNYRRRRVGGKRIDLILVGPGVDVERVGINAVRYDGAAASDHEPVQAVLREASPADRPDARQLIAPEPATRRADPKTGDDDGA